MKLTIIFMSSLSILSATNCPMFHYKNGEVSRKDADIPTTIKVIIQEHRNSQDNKGDKNENGSWLLNDEYSRDAEYSCCPSLSVDEATRNHISYFRKLLIPCFERNDV